MGVFWEILGDFGQFWVYLDSWDILDNLYQFRPILVDFGQFCDRQTDKHTLALLYIDIREILEKYWRNIGEILEKYWRNIR